MSAKEVSESDFKFDVRFFMAPDDLAPCFSIIYRIDVNVPPGRSVEDCLLPEWANIRFATYDLPVASVKGSNREVSARFTATGPSSCPIHFRLRRTRIWGMGFLPSGWARFIDLPANESANTVQPGTENPAFAHFAPLAEFLCGTHIGEEEQFHRTIDFFRKLAPPHKDSARIQSILDVMYDPYLTQVSEFSDKAGMTKRTLERVCLRHFGFSPQMLIRRQRTMRSLAAFMLKEEANWRETIDHAYHDQAHFVREFQSFMGMTPSEYAKQDHPILSAFMEERNRVWGPAVPAYEPPSIKRHVKPIARAG